MEQNNLINSNESSFNLNEQKNVDLCQGCSKCCEYVAMQIDTPETQDDFENIRWYLLHENVKVFVVGSDFQEDEEDANIETSQEIISEESEDEIEEDEDEDEGEQWFIQFQTKCKKLNSNGLCTIYQERPEICRNHSQETCEKYVDKDDTKVEFDNADDFSKWVNENYDFEFETEENND